MCKNNTNIKQIDAGDSLFSRIINGSEEIILRLDPVTLKIRAANREFYIHFNIPEAELKIPFLELLPASEHDKFLACIRQSKQNSKFNENIHTVLINRHSEKMPFEIKCLSMEIAGTEELVLYLKNTSQILQVENALRKQGAQFRQILDNSDELIFTLTTDHSFFYTSNSWEKILGYTENLCGRPISDIVHPIDRKRVQSGIRKVFSTAEKLPEMIVKFLDVNQNARIFNLRLSYSPKNIDSEMYVIGVAQDINESYLSKISLQESRANLLAVMENTRDLILSIDRNYKLLTANSAFFKSFKVWANSDLKIGDSVIDIFPAEKQAEWIAYVNRALNGEAFNVLKKFNINDKHYYKRVFFNPIFQQQRITGVSIFGRDVTTEYLTQIELFESNQRYRTLVEEIPMAMLVLDSAKILFANPAAKELLCLKNEAELQQYSEQFSRYVFDLATNVKDKELQIKDLQGNLKDLQITSLPIQFDKENASLLLLNDITQWKITKKALIDSQQKFVTLMDQSPFAIEIYDPAGNLIHTNNYWLEMWQIPPDEDIMKINFFTNPFFVNKNYAKKVAGAFEGKSGEISKIHITTRIKPKSKKWIHCLFYPIKDSAGIITNVAIVNQDITVAVETKKAILENETKYSTLFNEAVNAIFILRDGIIVDCNAATLEMFDTTRKDIINKPPSAFSPEFQPDGQLSVKKAQEKIFQTLKGEKQIFDWVHHQKTGRLFHTEVSLSHLKLERKDHLLAIVQDVSERKKNEQDLLFRLGFERIINTISARLINLAENKIKEELNHALRQIGEYIGTDITHLFIFDEETNKIGCLAEWQNDKAVKIDWTSGLYRWEKNNWWYDILITHQTISFSSAAEIPAAAAHFKTQFLKEGIKSLVNIPVFNNKILIGFIGLANIRREIIWPENIRNLLKIVSEIFSNAYIRTKMERAIRKSEQKYRDIFENISDVYYETSLTGEILEISPSCENIFGQSREELIGKNVAEFYHSEVHRKNLLDQLLTLEHVPDFEIELNLKNNLKKSCTLNCRLIRDQKLDSGKIIGVMRDISASKTMETQLRQAQKMDSIGRLAGGIAHDFNNLLTVIRGYSELILLGMEEDNPLSRSITQIDKAAERAESLTRQLLTFSRKQVHKLEVVNLNRVIHNTSKMLKRLLTENINLNIQLEPELKNIKADPGQLEQVIMNLVLNARDALPGGGKIKIITQNFYEPSCPAPERIPTNAEFVHLQVIDTGTGITEDIKDKIFEPFFTTKSKHKGTGLGLATVYGIIQLSKGIINFETKKDRGTTFNVFFPAVSDDLSNNIKNSKLQEDLRGTETILLVEDEEHILNMIQKILKNYGYKSLTAPNGETALEIFKEHYQEIDLVVSDVVMPGMNGRETMEKLLKIKGDIPNFYISGYTNDVIDQHGLLDDGIQFLQKPFTPVQFAQKIREVLDNL